MMSYQLQRSLAPLCSMHFRQAARPQITAAAAHYFEAAASCPAALADGDLPRFNVLQLLALVGRKLRVVGDFFFQSLVHAL